MRNMPKAQQLDTCVCDGTERTICEYVKVSMKNFCFDSMDRYAGSGFSDSDSEDDYDDMEDYVYVENASDSAKSACRGVWTSTVATILVLMRLI